MDSKEEDIKACLDMIERCCQFLLDVQGLRMLEVTVIDAQQHFQTVREIVELAHEKGVIDVQKFMVDAYNINNWTDFDNKVLADPHIPERINIINKKEGLKLLFSYKTHCREPIETIYEQAKEKLAALGPSEDALQSYTEERYL